jgi:hypothetical protein
MAESGRNRILACTTAYLVVAAGCRKVEPPLNLDRIAGHVEIELDASSGDRLSGRLRITLTAADGSSGIVRLRGPVLVFQIDGAPIPSDLDVDVRPRPGPAFELGKAVEVSFRIQPGTITTELGLPLLAAGPRRLSLLVASDPSWASMAGPPTACLRFESGAVPFTASGGGEAPEAARRVKSAPLSRRGGLSTAYAHRALPLQLLDGYARPEGTTLLEHGRPPFLVSLRPGEAWDVRCIAPEAPPPACSVTLGSEGRAVSRDATFQLRAPPREGIYPVACSIHRGPVLGWVRVIR